MEMISKKVQKYNKIVKLINDEIENLVVTLEKSIRINIGWIMTDMMVMSLA
jgi:hypothetical protein